MGEGGERGAEEEMRYEVEAREEDRQRRREDMEEEAGEE